MRRAECKGKRSDRRWRQYGVYQRCREIIFDRISGIYKIVLIPIHIGGRPTYLQFSTLNPYEFWDYQDIMPQKSRIDALGAPHHIIVRGIERCKIFLGDTDQVSAIVKSAQPCCRSKFAVLLGRSGAWHQRLCHCNHRGSESF